MQRIRKGDEVIVITGRDKGKRGTVLSRVDDRHVRSKASMLSRSILARTR